MAEPRSPLERTSVLADHEAALSATASTAFSLRELPPATRFSLRLDPAIAADVGAIGGFAIAGPINRHAGDDDRAIRIGPDEWLLLSERDAAAITQEVGQALQHRHFSLVDVSHRNTAFEIAGSAAEAVLNTGCPLDLDAAVFPPGAATRTLFGKAEIILIRQDGAATFRLECWRSFARYLRSLLIDAAKLQGVAGQPR